MITINVGGREYDSWDALPEEVRAQLLAAGVDPGPDGRLDSVDLSRAHGSVTRRTTVTGPGGAPLPPVVAEVLSSIADALGSALHGAVGPVAPTAGRGPVAEPDASPAPTTTESLPAVERAAVETDAEDTGDTEDTDASAPARSRRVPRVLAWVVIAGTVLLVATVVVIGLSGV
ncbi:hypothetical protein ASE25_05440 [Terrabacter sp. Root85]|uniref:hypothetical protein n=1 Tax=Terrabacter sp. Root85 TaxID=1736603 RepID=UPI0006FEA9E9|nr:hypothetical protein [Terrabacter sp. Root85]KRC92750.1 hypothetical protein ASE25_05440 [Terrabacter sp. Root85]